MTRCPEPYCQAATREPRASGWHEIEDTWWCPLHFNGEQRRLRKQRDEIAWYNAQIRACEETVRNQGVLVESTLAAAKRAGLPRNSPQVERQLARIENRVNQARDDLTTLRANRGQAAQRHERENERRENDLWRNAPKFDEN